MGLLAPCVVAQNVVRNKFPKLLLLMMLIDNLVIHLAYICHRKHDCKLKKTSPTAYCDCWEKSDCKTLVEGNSAKRLQVWHNSDLSLIQPNSNLFTAFTIDVAK